ncbi:MAG: tRNA (N6-threonylcarbamoyladenosine(37)-N6)-methyltransferase TrmO [Eggerthellaceae bacterium]|nr:tRNA (N6-threonylcarbamoyladenosine(37)-N6)-methyltransferase TrmO [Eggerthellaceae bacterium]
MRATITDMEPIAYIEAPFPQKFGIPRQSGLADTLACIRFEPKYADADAVKGLDGFSHIWLIWEFQDTGDEWSPTVRPPLLGGNKHMGVFATRSPFRPNPIGLSSVVLDRIEYTDEGPILYVRGADLRDGTPILDIKPYLAYTDSHPDALGGFTDEVEWQTLDILIDEGAADAFAELAEDTRDGLLQILAQDPRPARQRNLSKDFTITYANINVTFRVEEGVATITRIEALS